MISESLTIPPCEVQYVRVASAYTRNIVVIKRTVRRTKPCKRKGEEGREVLYKINMYLVALSWKYVSLIGNTKCYVITTEVNSRIANDDVYTYRPSRDKYVSLLVLFSLTMYDRVLPRTTSKLLNVPATLSMSFLSLVDCGH